MGPGYTLEGRVCRGVGTAIEVQAPERVVVRLWKQHGAAQRFVSVFLPEAQLEVFIPVEAFVGNELVADSIGDGAREAMVD
jgi:hypothetical protein